MTLNVGFKIYIYSSKLTSKAEMFKNMYTTRTYVLLRNLLRYTVEPTIILATLIEWLVANLECNNVLQMQDTVYFANSLLSSDLYCTCNNTLAKITGFLYCGLYALRTAIFRLDVYIGLGQCDGPLPLGTMPEYM